MTVRAHLVLTLITGYLFTVDGLHLQYKSSLNKKSLSIQDIQNEQLRLPRDIRKLLKNKKRLIVLDRKDEKVKKFLQELYNVIEETSSKQAAKTEERQKEECYRAFGSIYNPNKPHNKCKGRKPTIKVLKVKVIPVEKSFIDSTRQGSDDDSFSDQVENSKIIHVEDFNAQRDEDNDSKNLSPISIAEFKTRKTGRNWFGWAKNFFHTTEPPNKQKSSSEENVLIGNMPKRFEVVKNVDESKNTKYITNENNDDSDEEPWRQEPEKQKQKPHKTQFVHKIETQQTKDESNEDDHEEPWRKPQKQKQKLKKPQKSQFIQPDATDSDDWQSKIKQKNKPTNKKQKHVVDSSVEFHNSLEDIWTTTETNQKKSKKRKREKNRSSKYVYMQGSRFVNSDLESEEARRADRDFNIFMPKNKFWNSEETHHLGYYWYNGPQVHG